MEPIPYDPARGIPPEEKKIRQRLGAAMMGFVEWVTLNRRDPSTT